MSQGAETPPYQPPQPPQWRPMPTPMPTRERPPLPMIVTPLDADTGDDVATQLLDRRILLLTGRLDRDAADLAAARLLLMDERGHEVITVHVGCPAAELDAALTLVATLDLIQSPVRAIAVGTIGGAAVAVYAAAGERIAHPHASFLLHDPRVEVEGDASDITVAAEQREHEVATLHERVAHAAGRDQAAVAADMHAGKLLPAAAAVDYGLVQSLTSPR